MAVLSSREQEALNALCELFLEGPNIFVSGTSVRLRIGGGPKDSGAALRALAPAYAKSCGQEPDSDQWEPTLNGLLLSQFGEFARAWIAHVLQLLHRKARREGAFVRYEWSELKAVSSTEDDAPLASVSMVIRAAGLEVRCGRLPAPDLWYWSTPRRLEDLLEVNDADQLLAFRQNEAGAGSAKDLRATPPGAPTATAALAGQTTSDSVDVARPQVDIGIVVIKSEEFDAVLEAFPDECHSPP